VSVWYGRNLCRDLRGYGTDRSGSPWMRNRLLLHCWLLVLRAHEYVLQREGGIVKWN